MRINSKLALGIVLAATAALFVWLVIMAMPSQAGGSHCPDQSDMRISERGSYYPCPTTTSTSSTTTTSPSTTTTVEATTTTTMDDSESSTTTTIPKESTTTPTVPPTSPPSSAPPVTPPARSVTVTCDEVTVTNGPVDFQLVGVTVTLDDGTYTHGGEPGDLWAAWEVDSDTLITSGELPACVLPFTGANTTLLILAAITLVAGGVAVLKRHDDEVPDASL